MGTVDVKSIIEPTRFISRHKNRDIKVYEAECTQIDPESKSITIQGKTEKKKKKKEESDNKKRNRDKLIFFFFRKIQ